MFQRNNMVNLKRVKGCYFWQTAIFTAKACYLGYFMSQFIGNISTHAFINLLKAFAFIKRISRSNTM